MSKENIPEFMLQFWKNSPTVYTKDDIIHLEPFSENAVFLKYLALTVFKLFYSSFYWY